MTNWKECKLGDVVRSNVRSVDRHYSNQAIQYLDTGSITCGKVDALQKILLKDAPSRARRLVRDKDIIYSTVRPIQRHYGFIKSPPTDLVVSTGFSVIEVNQDLADPLFIYYFLTSDEIVEALDIIAEASTSTYPSLRPEDIERLDLLLPPPEEQRAIALVLSRLDEKIDLLHRQNKTLESVAETLFRKWCIEDMRAEWKVRKLGEFFPVVTGKKDANYSTEDGAYPFFTCSQNVFKAPGYSFSGSAILLAGNGDFNIKRCVGKFEAYQRTYVLMPNELKYYNFLYVLIRYFLSEITGGYQGSVINFITKGMIEDFEFKAPPMLENVLAVFDNLYNKYDFNRSQIVKLEQLRGDLLSKLISGEVRVAHGN